MKCNLGHFIACKQDKERRCNYLVAVEVMSGLRKRSVGGHCGWCGLQQVTGALVSSGVAVQVSLGFVLSGPSNRCPVVTKFACQLKLLELLEHKSIFTAGYKSILHIHSITEECEVLQLDFEMDLKTKQKKRCRFAKSNASVLCKIVVSKPICVEPFEVNPQMGRFTLRDEGKTIAIGKVTKLPPPAK